MAAAPRHHEDREQRITRLLELLHQEYQKLPPAKSRYYLLPGTQFLTLLRRLRFVEDVPVARLALATGTSTQNIYKLLKKPRPRSSKPPPQWPAADDLRELQAAWRVAMVIGTPRRRSQEFTDVHQALRELLNRFSLLDIATALGQATGQKVEPRRLQRYENPPPMPEDLSRAVRASLPPQKTAMHTDWQER